MRRARTGERCVGDIVGMRIAGQHPAALDFQPEKFGGIHVRNENLLPIKYQSERVIKNVTFEHQRIIGN